MDLNHTSFGVGHIPCPPTLWLFFRQDWSVPVSVSWVSALMTRTYGLLSVQIRQTVLGCIRRKAPKQTRGGAYPHLLGTGETAPGVLGPVLKETIPPHLLWLWLQGLCFYMLCSGCCCLHWAWEAWDCFAGYVKGSVSWLAVVFWSSFRTCLQVFRRDFQLAPQSSSSDGANCCTFVLLKKKHKNKTTTKKTNHKKPNSLGPVPLWSTCC